MGELTNYEQQMAEKTKAVVASERSSVSTISLQAGQISYGGQPVPGNKLECIITAGIHANFYYEGKWDPDNIVPPVCFAYSEDGKDMAPHPNSTKPQCETCDDCPMNKYDSDPSGRGGKACKNQRSLALLPAGTQDARKAEVALLKVPVMSVKNYSDYVNKIATLYNRPPSGVITTVSTEPNKKSQFKLTFGYVDVLSPEVGSTVLAREESLLKLLQRTYEPEEPKEEKKRKM